MKVKKQSKLRRVNRLCDGKSRDMGASLNIVLMLEDALLYSFPSLMPFNDLLTRQCQKGGSVNHESNSISQKQKL